MTNVMAATYPNLFKAATAYSGVPAGCFVSTGETSAPAAGSTPAWNSTCAQAGLGLTRHQLQLFKQIRKDALSELDQAAAQRAEIKEGLQGRDIEHVLCGDIMDAGSVSFCESVKVLDAAAALTANTALQTEIIMHARRRFVFQVCTPEKMSNLICNASPCFFDLSQMLEFVADRH